MRAQAGSRNKASASVNASVAWSGQARVAIADVLILGKPPQGSDNAFPGGMGKNEPATSGCGLSSWLRGTAWILLSLPIYFTTAQER